MTLTSELTPHSGFDFGGGGYLLCLFILLIFRWVVGYFIILFFIFVNDLISLIVLICMFINFIFNMV
jgi:hypothetical protein